MRTTTPAAQRGNRYAFQFQGSSGSVLKQRRNESSTRAAAASFSGEEMSRMSCLRAAAGGGGQAPRLHRLPSVNTPRAPRQASGAAGLARRAAQPNPSHQVAVRRRAPLRRHHSVINRLLHVAGCLRALMVQLRRGGAGAGWQGGCHGCGRGGQEQPPPPRCRAHLLLRAKGGQVATAERLVLQAASRGRPRWRQQAVSPSQMMLVESKA